MIHSFPLQAVSSPWAVSGSNGPHSARFWRVTICIFYASATAYFILSLGYFHLRDNCSMGSILSTNQYWLWFAAIHIPHLSHSPQILYLACGPNPNLCDSFIFHRIFTCAFLSVECPMHWDNKPLPRKVKSFCWNRQSAWTTNCQSMLNKITQPPPKTHLEKDVSAF